MECNSSIWTLKILITIFFYFQRIIRHPEYSFSRKKNDIALIEFTGSVEFSDLVRPACIRTDTSDIPESRELIIAGWGSIEAESNLNSKIAKMSH